MDSDVCPECGWALNKQSYDDPAGSGNMKMRTTCSNPDCPTVESDLAPIAEHERDRLR